MVRVYGPDRWPTVDRLRAATANVEGELVVCWGVKYFPYGTERALNGMSKLNARQQLTVIEDSGCPVVAWCDNQLAAVRWVLEDGQTVWGRRDNHTQGRDIVGPGVRRGKITNQHWLGSDFWVVPEPDVISEWRIHVWLGHSIARGQKVRIGEDVRHSRWGDVVRSRKNGWVLEHTERPPEGVREVAKRAVAAVGYDFGAVDVLVTETRGPVVLEVNSAPAIGDAYTMERYVDAIQRTVRGEW